MSDSSTSPQAPSSGEVIPFPTRKREAPQTVNVTSAASLAQSVGALQQALAEQAAAVAAWRAALAELRGAVQGLGTSLALYRGSLDVLGNRVETLGAEARVLESRASAAIPGN